MMYLDLLPEQMGALWALLDAEYLHPHTMIHFADTLTKIPDFCHYKGDRLEEVCDIAALKVLGQLRNPLETGNIELSDHLATYLREALEDLYRDVPV